MRRKENSEITAQNKQKIMDTATRLFLKQGASETSLAAIAKELGISKGTLYYYYPSKNELIFDITERHMNQITGDLLSWVESIGKDKDPVDVLEYVFKTILGAETRGKLHIYLIHEAISGNAALRKRFRETYKEWRRMLEYGLDKVMKGKDDHKVRAELILTVIDGALIQHMLGVRANPLRDIISPIMKE